MGAVGTGSRGLNTEPSAPTDKTPSLNIDIGWAFSSGKPSGIYKLTGISCCNPQGNFTNGAINLKRLASPTGSGTLTIILKDGPSYKADVALDLPNIQSAAGLARRLTNLGFYAGTDGICDGRMQWAIRAFKRKYMNELTHNSKEFENNEVTQAFLSAVQRVYGAHSGDAIPAAGLSFPEVTRESSYCGMFGTRTYRRGSFEKKDALDDVDQSPERTGLNAKGVDINGVWEGKSSKEVKNEPIAGNFTIYLRAFDPDQDNKDFANRINLPQPIHMAQFVLFELGYWLVDGPETEKVKKWVQLDNTWTRNNFRPDGGFGRCTQWAVREFQCHAKLDHAAKEDVASTEKRYLPRLFKLSKTPPKLSSNARYPDKAPISGALNEATKKALQAWADGALRCPVIVCATNDIKDGTNLDKIVKENLWLHNDLISNGPRMYAIDYSNYYFSLPDALFPSNSTYKGLASKYGGKDTSGTFPKPIVLGYYEKAYDGGPCSVAGRHTWQSTEVEIRPDTLIGEGGNNGIGLSGEQLSTFKVIRTVSHFECYGFFDCINAYDDVTISFGPCHWTAQGCMGGEANAIGGRELPAFLSYIKHTYPDNYQAFFGNFGLASKNEWPIALSGGVNTYNDKFTMQTENDVQNLCGNFDRLNENKYLKNWHWYYRFLMATRISSYLHRGMWHFTRIRIGDILNHEFEFVIGQGKDKKTKKVKVGQYVTSQKAVAMLLRWHIRFPGSLFRNLREIMEYCISKYPDLSDEKQSRENDVISKIMEKCNLVDNQQFKEQMKELNEWKDVPQFGFDGRAYYKLNLSNKALSSELKSFVFDDLPI